MRKGKLSMKSFKSTARNRYGMNFDGD